MPILQFLARLPLNFPADSALDGSKTKASIRLCRCFDGRNPLYPLKYASQLFYVPNCPPKHYCEATRHAFRLVFSELTHPHSFTPPAIIVPSRKWKSDEEHCESFALSLFESEIALVDVMHKLEKSVRYLRKRLGDKIASGTVRTEDGVMSDIDETGHFNLHESATCNLVPQFCIVKDLP